MQGNSTSRPMRSESGAGVLYELEHPDVEVPAPGAKDHSQRGGGLALALARVDYYEAMAHAAAPCSFCGPFAAVCLSHRSQGRYASRSAPAEVRPPAVPAVSATGVKPSSSTACSSAGPIRLIAREPVRSSL